MWRRKNIVDDLPPHHHELHHHKVELEILKAVAQAWLNRHEAINDSSSSNEFDTRRRNFNGQPTRFRVEAMKKKKKKQDEIDSSCSSCRFSQSLWDSYEIVAVSKRLEEGLVLDDEFSGFVLEEGDITVVGGRKRKESKNSLRNLFNMVSGRKSNS